MRRIIRVVPHEAGLRLDRLLTTRISELGRKRARSAFLAGQVTIAGRKAKRSDTARCDEEIAVELEIERAPVAEPDLALSVRFECDDFVVVAKPAGMPSAPLDPSERGTLAG